MKDHHQCLDDCIPLWQNIELLPRDIPVYSLKKQIIQHVDNLDAEYDKMGCPPVIESLWDGQVFPLKLPWTFTLTGQPGKCLRHI